MILKDLLQSVDFRKVADAYKKLYPQNANDIVFLKCHYDILCNTVPKSDGDSQVCRISMEYDDIFKKQYLSAFSLEGDKWPYSLSKTIEIAPNLNISLEEVAACCLWHTSFYGYTEEQLANTAEDFSEEWRDKSDLEMYQLKLTRNLATIKLLYNYNSTLPSRKDVYDVVKSRANERNKIYKRKHIKKRIRNRWFRREFFRTEYYRYLYELSQFILDVKTLDESINELCQFSRYKRVIFYNYRSYTYGKCDPAKYLQELIEEYQAFNKTYRNVYIFLVRANENNSTLTESEYQLCYSIISSCSDWGSFYISTKYNSSLANEIRMYVAFYE